MPTRFANTINGDPIYALRAMCDKNGLDFTQYYAKLTDLPDPQVQADWSVSDPTSKAFIKNKPDLSVFALSSSLATVATSGSYNDLQHKPAIPAAQVQSDYGQTDTSAVDFIKNKPDLSIYAEKSELAAVATTGDYDDLQHKPSIPAAQVQSDWSQSDSNAVDYIKNKPSIPAPQVQSDWSQSDSNAVDFIKNKPTINNVPTVTSIDDGKVLKASYSGGVGAYSWEPESSGGSSNVVLTYGTSTWADFTAALATNSVIFCDVGSGRYAVMAYYSTSTLVEFQYVRTVNDTQWPLSSNGYNCEVYKFTLDSSNNWTTTSYPVAFKPVTGNGIKLYSNANRELQFAVDLPVYTDGNNSILWLGANGSLSIASSLFASKNVTKTYTSPKAGGPVFASQGSTSSNSNALGNRFNNACDQSFDSETVTISFTGTAASVTANRTNLRRWNDGSNQTVNGDLVVKYGLFHYDTLQTSTPFKAAADPKLIVDLENCGTLASADTSASITLSFASGSFSSVIVPKDTKFFTAFYTVVGGVRYFFTNTLNPYGSTSNLSITSTMTGSVATLISVPASTSADEGKVLTVDSSGNAVWAAGGGGGTQQQADWSQTDSNAVDYIKNKPSLANVATTGSYSDLSNKPTIPSLFNYTEKSVSNTGSGTSHRMVINENYPVKYILNGGYTHDSTYRDLNIRENANAMKNDWIATTSGQKNYVIKIYDSNNTLSTRYTFVYFSLSTGTSGISTGGSASVSGNYNNSTLVIHKTGSLILVYVS